MNYAPLTYEELKEQMERKLAKFKGGLIPQLHREKLADEWASDEIIDPSELDPTIVSIEAEALAKRWERYNAPALGEVPITRPNGVYRFMYCQLNSASTNESRELKSEEILTLVDKYDIQGVAIAEHCTNFSRYQSSQGLQSWFQQGGRNVKATSAHNRHAGKNAPKYLPGGTGLIAFNELIQCVKTSNVDFRGLGRFTSWVLSKGPNHRTRFVIAYGVGRGRPKGLSTHYQQVLRYIQEDDSLSATGIKPRRLFELDLHACLRVWRGQGERILLFMDVNDHIQHGRFMKELLSDDKLNLQERSHHCWGDKPPRTYINGEWPIDCAAHTDDIEIPNFLLLPFSLSPGDHRTMILDVTTQSLFGEYEFKIVYPPCRRLSTRNKKSMGKYLARAEQQMDIHKLQERIDECEAEANTYPVDPSVAAKMERIDEQVKEIQLASEAKCRKITKVPLPFSEPVKYWVMRRRSYMELIKFQKGRTRNNSNLIRRAKKMGIPDPKSLSLSQLNDGVRYCKLRLKSLEKDAKGHRKVLLRDCFIRAKESGDEERAKGVQRVIRSEESRKIWFLINRVTDDPRSGGVMRVERVVDGVKETYVVKEDMEQAIQTETEYRFQLAHSAKIHSSSLAYQLGYLSDTEVAKQILEGTYEIPDDIDDATALILDEIARIGMEIVSHDGEKITITPEDFRRYWKAAKEKTSSSISDIHFAHYKAAVHSDKITALLSKKLTVIARCGIPPSRWGSGLQVMLEKIAGVALVNKLRAILLMEADYNFHNKWVFGHKALDKIMNSGYIPEGQFSKRESTAEDAKMDTKLTYDISRQLRHPMGELSVDASNCYDRISHIIMSLLLLAITGWLGAVVSLLSPIQTMKFYQRTGLGDSTSYMGGPNLSRLLQGLCQGNGAAPACWTMLSAVIMHCYTIQGFGSRIVSPISDAIIEFIGSMFVDDTTLHIMRPDLRSAIDLWREMQVSSYTWSDLLNSSGGALKPVKCFGYLVDYEFNVGEWRYKEMVDWEMMVRLPDDTEEPIAMRGVHHEEEMLGVWSSPAGDEKEQTAKITKRVEKWTTRTGNGHLPAKYAWMSYKMKLWPGIRYGLATMATPLAIAATLLSSYHYRMLSFLGVNRHFKRERRTLPRAFGGVGLFSFSIEHAICMINMLVQHFGVPSVLGKKFSASLETLQLDAGLDGNPLQADYDRYGVRCTDCWLKTLWERLHAYGFKIYLDYPTIPHPREGDMLIADIIYDSSETDQVKRILHRCRIHKGMLFLSDIAAANGRHLDRSFLNRDDTPSHVSRYTFPREEPTDSDWSVWKEFWYSYLTTQLVLPRPLGRWLYPTHRQWKWFFNDGEILYRTDGGVVHYGRREGRTRTRGEQIYVIVRFVEGEQISGLPCTVVELGSDTVLLQNSGPEMAADSSSTGTFWEYLRSWGGDWMWDGIQDEQQDISWLVEGLKSGTLICVTDGSYDRNFAPDISGAGFVLCCTKARKQLRANFYERSKSASSYRGELLGLTALHTLLLALKRYFRIDLKQSKICCDNISALRRSEQRRRRVKTGAAQADLLRVLRTLTYCNELQLRYEHVDAHQDRKKLWWQLTLEEQLNCVCDDLAKKAVRRSFATPLPREGPYILPMEKAAVIINGEKLTSDVSKEVRYVLGKADAERFYTATPKARGVPGGGLGWSSDRFHQVAWDSLHDVLERKPDMFQLWLTKQSSGMCATRVHMSRLHDLLDNKCPNCGREERADHLNQCPSEYRTRLITEETESLEQWMRADSRTDSELAFYIPKYILFRGMRSMSSLGPMSARMAKAARSQDMIGWREFMEGRVSKEFLMIQTGHCALAPTRLNGGDWMRQFINRILLISHSQWIFRNFTLHDQVRGYLRLQERKEVLREIDRLIDLEPTEIPAESRFLLEFDFDSLYRSSFEKQSYWVRAMKAARRAGRRTALVQSRRGASARRREARRRPSRPVIDTSTVEEQLMRQLTLQRPLSRRRVNDSSLETENPCNKRLKKPD
jgi:hypothetical protein